MVAVPRGFPQQQQAWEIPLSSALVRGYWEEVAGFEEYLPDGLPVKPWR